MRKSASKAAAFLFTVILAFSCAKEAGDAVKGSKLSAPEIKIATLGTTSFSIKWGRVEGAAQYAYEFAGVTATTDTTVLVVDGLQEKIQCKPYPDREYQAGG